MLGWSGWKRITPLEPIGHPEKYKGRGLWRHAVFHAVVCAFDDDGLGMMREAVEDDSLKWASSLGKIIKKSI